MRSGVLRLLPIVAALAVLTVLAFPGTASAAPNTIVVTTTADDDAPAPSGCTLRDAIASANTDSAVGGCTAGVAGADTIDVPAGTYFLDLGQLLVSSDMDIVGAGARSTLISGIGTQRDFEISQPGGPISVTIAGVTIENGNTTLGGNEPNAGVGGGIWVDNTATVTLQDSTVMDNAADHSGGGIDSDGSLTVLRSTVENNSTGNGGFGGGVDDFGPSLTITNSTIMANAAQGDGGGLFLGSGAQLLNDTIANNHANELGAGGTGGGIALGSIDPHTVFLTNTLLAGNFQATLHNDCSTGIASLGHNLADDASCGLTATGDLESTNPQLGSVDSSGPTDVLPLTSGSPAINAGDDLACPATDQLGVSRPWGPHCDIGAVEFVPPTTIAFESNRFGSSEIFAMNGDGSNVVQLTNDPGTATDSLPSISPDGHTIAYQQTVGGVSQIWTMNGDGTNQHPLTSVGSNSQPAFSPDGTKIAFDSDRGGTPQLFVMNADGSAQTQVMPYPGRVGGASWSPDGSQIAFNGDSTGSNEIYKVNVTTGNVTGPLTTVGSNTNPHWSPDGTKILFVSTSCTTCSAGESVFVMNADGSNQQNVSDAPIFDADPAWSPDGSHIAFVRDLGGQNFNVFTARADGTNQVQLTQGTAPQRNSFPSWGVQVGVATDTIPPTATMSAPLDGAGLSGRVWLGGNVVDGGSSPSGIAAWSFQEAAVSGRVADPTTLSYSDIGAAGTSSGDVSTSWDTSGSGDYYVRLKATDNANNVGFSTPVFVTVDNSNPNGVFQVDSPSISSLDPLTWNQVSNQILYATCAKLYNAPDTAGQASLANLQPELAAGPPQVSADRLTWTFQIASGWKFSDGTPITASDLKRIFTRATDPTNSATEGNVFSDVTSALANGSTLTLQLSKPDEALPAKLASSTACAIPQTYPTAPQATAPPGSGPYYVASYVPGKQLILDRNPYYVGSRPSNFDRFVYTLGVSPSQAETDVANNAADYAAGGWTALPKADLSSLGSTYGSRFFEAPALGLRYITYNTQRTAFASATTRNEVSSVLDRSQYAADLPGEASEATDQLLPPGVPGFTDWQIYSSKVTDDTAVATALKSAGITPSTINLYAVSSAGMDQVVTDVAARFTHLGFTVNVVREPSSQFFGAGPGGILNPSTPFDLAITGWTGDYPDPNDFLNRLLDPNFGLDWSGFDDPTELQNMRGVDAIPFGPSRFAEFQKLDLALSRDYAPMTAFENFDSTDFFSDRVGCQTYNPFFGMDLAALCAGTATSASATATSGSTVGMSGSNDAITAIPLSAFQVTASGVTPATVNGLPINALPINALPINALPINALPINALPINALPINALPINALPINALPINALQIPGGWTSVLAGTALAGQPLQTITLQQVLNLTPQPAAVRSLTLGDLEVADSQLGQMTLGALALGGTPINALGSEADTFERQLQAWCEGAIKSGDPVTECSLTNIGSASLFSLGLAGAPINALPINALPINALPINALPINALPIEDLDLSASPINALPINALPTGGLNGVALSAVVDCTKVDCSTATLGEAAAAGAIVPGATYGQLLDILLADGSPVQTTLTLGDVIGLLIRRSDVPWENLGPRALSVLDPSRPTLGVSAQFSLQGSGTPPADVSLKVPDGFDYDPGSATLSEGGGPPQSLADPRINGQTLDWQLAAVDTSAPYTIAFKLRSGTDVGAAQVTETVTSGSQSASSVAAFSVSDSYATSSDPSTAPSIAPNASVQMSALPSPGAVDYYKIPLPPAGARIQVHLTNLPADYDLALYSSQTTSVRTGGTTAPPLQDGIVSDPQIDLGGGSNGQLTPTALQDVPDPGIPVVQVSANRGTQDEDVGMVSPGGGGDVTIAVFGYNGAFSPQPYSLRVTTTAAPAAQTCHARSLPDAGQGTTPDSLPNLSSLPANLNTIILVDEQRLGDTYGSTAEANALASLHHLAGDTSLGVSGVVVPVEQISGVQSLYGTWDSNPCDPDAANAVANAIANEVDAIKAAATGVQYVVFGGGDDQIPFFRLPDLSRLANEDGFAGQFGANEYGGALGAGDLLSDNPYLDTRPIPASGRQLFVPDLVGGRLVETAADISNAVTSFESSGGVLRSSTAFVSGYDFVADGSQQAANRLTSLLGTGNVHTLIDSTTPFVPTTAWSESDLLAAAFPGGVPYAINDWNGHYDNTQAEMANGSILSTQDLTGTNSFNGGIFFTMGCHAGFQTSDVVVGSSVLDWPQYFAEHNTGFVGNTGFGLGDTDSVAFSEELMSDFAGNLGGSSTLGEALTQAKDQYYLSRVAFSNYDEKTLSEAELYGLPMYGVGHAPTPLADPPPDPVSGTTSSTSPSQGSLSPFTTGVQTASFAATPDFGTVVHGQDGDYFTNDGQVQAPNYRPLQPYVSLPAARSGLVAHGVVIDDLTSSDHTPFNPDNVRPTLDLSANEPEPQFTDEAWPEKIPTLVSLGSDQSLNLVTGQFFTESSASTGVERLWTQIGGRVTYSTSHDFTPPTIDSIDAFASNGVVGFSGRFSDLDQNGAPGHVVFAQVVYDDGVGNWNALQLQQGSSGAWTGGAPFSGDHVQYFVEVCDAAGNCGYSSNKGRYFDAQPLPSPTGTLTLTPDRGPDTGAWYTHGLNVTATTGAQAVSASVDGGSFSPVSGSIGLSGDGAHVVEARDSDGNTATAVYLIDTTGPAITPTASPAAPNGTNGWYVTKPSVSFACTDNLSGVASCPGSTTVNENDGTSILGTATDNAGNTSHISGIKVDVTPPTKPTFNGINSQSYPINSLPSSGAVKCSATDLLSGFDHCDVTGYSGTYGTHTLTATAYDKAGNSSTATLTYTVGLQAGDVLAPVAAPSGDQTNAAATDLQVFKIKSTIPLKFQFYLDAAKTTVMTTPPAGSVALLTVAKHDATTDSIDQTTLVTAPADSGNQFRWTGATAYQYVYNIATSKLTAGTYYCQITLYASDGTTVLGQSARQYFVLRS